MFEFNRGEKDQNDGKIFHRVWITMIGSVMKTFVRSCKTDSWILWARKIDGFVGGYWCHFIQFNAIWNNRSLSLVYIKHHTIQYVASCKHTPLLSANHCICSTMYQYLSLHFVWWSQKTFRTKDTNRNLRLNVHLFDFFVLLFISTFVFAFAFFISGRTVLRLSAPRWYFDSGVFPKNPQKTK